METTLDTTLTTIMSDAGLHKQEQYLLEQYNDEIRSAAMPGIVFVSILCFLGFFGNLFVLYVFMFRYKSCNFRYFVLCLCLTDLTSSLTTMPGEVVTQMFWYTYPYRMMCKVKSFFNVFTVCAEAFCLLTISVDRHRKVCRPHGWQIKTRVAIVLCGLVYVVAFILALPVPFFWGIHTEIRTYKGTNITLSICEKDQNFVYSKQPVEFSASVQGFVSVSLLVMMILYVLVARTLLKNKSNKKPLTRRAKPPETSSTIPTTNTLSCHIGVAIDPKTDKSDHKSGYSTYVDAELGRESPSIFTDGGTRTDDDTVDTISDFETLSDNKSDKTKRKQTRKARTSRKHSNMASRIQRKTRITFILSIVFVITMILYFTLLDLIAENILKKLSSTEKAVYFVFFRLVFINHVINPIVYGVLDPHFRREVRKLPRRIINCCS